MPTPPDPTSTSRPRRAGAPDLPTPAAVDLRLDFTGPLWPDSLFGHLAATAVPGVEEWRDGAYRRTLRLSRGGGIVSLRPGRDHVACRLLLEDGRDLDDAVARCRRLLDLDVDPGVVDGVLAGDPVLAPLVAAVPGRRVPGTVDAEELVIRAVLGQQVSTAAARTHAGRLVVEHGRAVHDPEGGLSHLWPELDALAGLDPERLALPRARRRTLTGVIDALVTGRVRVGPDDDPGEAAAGLAALEGIGPWTVSTVAMRALGDGDAWLPTDLGVRAAAARLGLPTTPVALTARARPWRPWRAYAVQHLWATGTHAVNTLPPDRPRPDDGVQAAVPACEDPS